MSEPKFFNRDLFKTEDQRMRERSAELDRQQRNADNAPAFEMRSSFGFRVESAPASPASLARRAVCGAMAEQVVEWRAETKADADYVFVQSCMLKQPVQQPGESPLSAFENYTLGIEELSPQRESNPEFDKFRIIEELPRFPEESTIIRRQNSIY